MQGPLSFKKMCTLLGLSVIYVEWQYRNHTEVSLSCIFASKVSSLIKRMTECHEKDFMVNRSLSWLICFFVIFGEKYLLEYFSFFIFGDSLKPEPSIFLLVSIYCFQFSQAPADFQYYNKYLAEPQVRKAIHVGNLTFHDGDKVEQHLINDILQSITPQLAKVMENYRVCVHTVTVFPLQRGSVMWLEFIMFWGREPKWLFWYWSFCW